MRDVKVSAKAAEARAATGFDLIQWRRFLLISRLEADHFVEAHPQYGSWIALPAHEQDKLWAAINARLDGERIPRINQSVLIWRMSQAMREARRLFVMNQEGEAGPIQEPPEVEQGYRSPYGSLDGAARSSAVDSGGTLFQPSPSPSQTPGRPTATYRPPYDPVKDAANTSSTAGGGSQ